MSSVSRCTTSRPPTDLRRMERGPADADVCLYCAVICLTRLALQNAIAPVPKMGALETVVREAEGRTELMSHQKVLV